MVLNRVIYGWLRKNGVKKCVFAWNAAQQSLIDTVSAIKDVMGMNILRCKSAQMVQKEVGVYFLAYNLNPHRGACEAPACARLLRLGVASK